MTEQDKQKLNEKLEKWAEWQPDWYGDVPNFTDSLDACFKWLVPKLKEYDGIEFWEDVDGWVCDVVRGKLTEHEEGIASSPALALCLAIEKLIEEK